MCNATVNNISVNSRRTALLVEETRVHREKHRPITDKLYHWIFIDICCGLFFYHLKRDVVVCFVNIGGFYFQHCLISVSINNNFRVFGLCQKGIKLMITLTLYTPLSQFLYTVVAL